MVRFLQSLLFENLPLLLIAEAVAIAIVLGVHRRNLTAGTRRAVWITLAICVALIGLQYLVQTDQERIEANVKAIALAIDDGDVPAVGQHLDREFQDHGLSKEAWLADLRQRLQRWQIDEAKV